MKGKDNFKLWGGRVAKEIECGSCSIVDLQKIIGFDGYKFRQYIVLDEVHEASALSDSVTGGLGVDTADVQLTTRTGPDIR